MRRSGILTRDRAELIGDAFLATAAASAVMTWLTVLIAAPDGDPRPGMEWAAAIGSFATMAMVLLVPVAVWLLHGRRLSWQAALGGVVGAVSAGAVFMLVAALSMVLGLVAAPFTDSEFAGPLAMLVIVSLALTAAVVWLLVDAFRDLRSGDPGHRHLDVIRLVSALVLAVFLAGTLWWVSAHPGDESGEAPIFLMLFGVSGALAVTGAEVLSSLAAGGQVRPGPLPTGGGGPPGAPS